MSVQTLIFEPRTLVAEGLAALVQRQPDMEVCVQCQDLFQVQAHLSQHSEVSLILWSVNNYHGKILDDVQSLGLGKFLPPILFVVDQHMPFQWKSLGKLKHLSWGILPIQATVSELCQAIDVLLEGRIYLPAHLMRTMAYEPEALRFTPSELAFLRWNVRDLTYKQMAFHMKGISVRTLDTVRQRLCSKTGCSSRVGLAVFAVRNRLDV